ncbi:MAG TPA: TonB family protein, partial [Candidatus Acidoferrum sp.]|nr:TonB family protein [Candidatus Acidoferrum sp.]
MGYQALLFCPDEKTAHTVTQVLSELDFAVTPCTEPFAAVKKLMGEHFDAVVVDCDNEQNATLLFKSARNTSSNQSSLAVAVVEGQAGVAKAFRIGANLVLTKPINVEQAKGTLRVARGLLRKNDAAKPAPIANSASPLPAIPKLSPQPATLVDAKPPQSASFPAVNTAIANIQTQKAASAMAATPENGTAEPSAAATADKNFSREIAKLPAIQTPALQNVPSSSDPKIEVTTSRAGFGISAASAPAPAREPKAVVPSENKSSVLPETKTRSKGEELKENASLAEVPSASPPMFTFGGTAIESQGSGSKKLLLIIAAAVVLIAAGGYAAWMHWGQSDNSSTVPNHVVETPVKAPVSPQAAPSPTPSEKVSAPDAQITASAETVEAHPSKITPATDTSKPSPSATNKAPAAKEAEEPIVIKNHLSRPSAKTVADNDAPAPPMLSGVAPAGNGGGLPNLIESPSKVPTPVLQALTVSQGVSQGLLVKKVQPKYPPSALRLHVEGGVQLLATISKSGDISAVKILSGDKDLSHAAADAVKQWKYKPYLLNGLPVEIQTQIT